MLVRPRSGRFSDRKVLRPMTTGLPMVMALKRCISLFNRQGMVLLAPITPLSATAAIITISIAHAFAASASSAEPVTRHSVHCAERLVEFDRGGVPVEHRPLQARPAVLDAGARKVSEQRLADAVAAELRAHEQVFEIDAETSGEGRVIEKPHGKAGRLAIPLRDLAE